MESDSNRNRSSIKRAHGPNGALFPSGTRGSEPRGPVHEHVLDLHPSMRERLVSELGPAFVREVLIAGEQVDADQLRVGDVIAEVRVSHSGPELLVDLYRIGATCNGSPPTCSLPVVRTRIVAFVLSRVFKASSLIIRQSEGVVQCGPVGQCSSASLSYRNGQVHYVACRAQVTELHSGVSTNRRDGEKGKGQAPEARVEERYRALNGTTGFFTTPGVWRMPAGFYKRIEELLTYSWR